MPNWAYVDYIVVGDKPQLDKLYQTLQDLEDRNLSLVENDFGKTWLGNLVAKLGGDPMKIYCRGEWTYLNRSENHVVISMEAAWGEPNEVRKFIEEQFPGIKIYFQSVTDETWQTNDKDGVYFPESYVLYSEERGEDYYSSLSDLIEEVQIVTGVSGLQTFEDCKKAMDRHYDGDEDACYYIDKFDIVD